MADARFVKLEGLEAKCLLISPDGQMPDELVVDFSGESSGSEESRGRVTYRLLPSSVGQAEPVYAEMFDE
jgi:hypothetical protein